MRRRRLLIGAAALLAAPAFATGPQGLHIQVFKSPSCGCCDGWIDHLRAAGFQPAVTEVDDTAVVRRRHGLPEQYGSCHTGVVRGYVVEGHVPAADVRRLLALKPAAIGIAVPGMPAGSPGMEVPGGRVDPYAVLLVEKSGRASVFARHR